MKGEDLYFDLHPKVVLAGKKTHLTIEPWYDYIRIDQNAKYDLCVIPMEHRLEGENFISSNFDVNAIASDVGLIPAVFKNGVFTFEYHFYEEQEHLIYLFQKTPERQLIGSFRVYSVENDLFERIPFKGDLHMHSFRSDGKDPPAFVAAMCRKIGLDFMAVTDHGQYGPSIEAQEAFDSEHIDLRIFNGEEIHPPRNPVHMVNFGGKFSVNDLFKKPHLETYEEEVAKKIEELGELPRGVNSYQYASCLWVFDKIKEAGGLGIFCHPYWLIRSGYSPSGPLTDYIFKTKPFGAYELIGGYYKGQVDSNTLQVARYHEERAKGNNFPIVGVSDAHGCKTGHLFGWYYTLVFSPSNSLPDIIASIKAGYSVAVEKVAEESLRAYGPFRMVKFALFALRELFREHDEYCTEEGRLMLRCLRGDTQASIILKKRKGKALESILRYYKE